MSKRFDLVDVVLFGSLTVLLTALVGAWAADQEGASGTLICDFMGQVIYTDVTNYRHRGTFHEYEIEGRYGTTDFFCIFDGADPAGVRADGERGADEPEVRDGGGEQTGADPTGGQRQGI